MHTDAMSTEDFRSRLRELRKLSGLTLDQVGHRVGVNESTVSRWEGGYNLPRHEHVHQLDKLLGADRELIRLWRIAESGSPLVPWEKRKPELEKNSHIIGYASPHVVPGYLQSPGYTRLILTNTFFPGSEADLTAEVERRSNRYETVLRAQGDPWVIAIFPLVALMCLPQAVRTEQANRLLSLIDDARVEVQIVGSDYPIPLASILHLYHLRSGDVVAASEHNQGAFVHGDPQVAQRLGSLFNHVSRLAMSKAESRNQLKGMT